MNDGREARVGTDEKLRIAPVLTLKPALPRRRMLQAILACGCALAGLSARAAKPTHAVNLPSATDLRQDGETSAREGVPVLLFFDRGDCPYCERALREFLVPMARGEEWSRRAIYRQVEIDDAERALVDFDGVRTTHRAFAQRHAITLTPTIMLFDRSGASLARPVVGLLTPDFYGAYLEQAIDTATARLKQATPKA